MPLQPSKKLGGFFISFFKKKLIKNIGIQMMLLKRYNKLGIFLIILRKEFNLKN
jgi:hypothetical protein